MSLEDRYAIQELNYQYAYYVDSFLIDQWTEVFSPDAYFDERKFGGPLSVGREAIHAYGDHLVEIVQHVVHLMSNHLIFDLTPTTATGVAFCLCESMRKTGERIRFHVKYEDEYTKVDGAWKISRRILRKSLPPEPMSTTATV